jgi:thiol-disulfide isomerase/thioredoxin
VHRVAFALSVLLAVTAQARAHEVGSRLPPETPLGSRLGGERVTLRDCAGKPALVVFWATWCSQCMKALPVLEELHEQWGERAVVLGVSGDASEADVREFLARNPIRLTIDLSHDRDTSVARAFGVRGLPTYFLIDRDGTLRWRRVGAGADFLADLATALRTLAKPHAEGT